MYNKNHNLLHCEFCLYTTSNKSDYAKHTTTRKHKLMTNNYTLAINGNDKIEVTSSTYTCSCCNYTTIIKCNYDKHLLTEKHKKNINFVEQLEERKHICSHCNKEYLNYNALWKHKKNCSGNKICDIDPLLQNTFRPNAIIASDIFLEVLKESKELQNVLVEQNKELQNKLLEKENKLLEQNKELQNKLLEQNNKLLEKENQLLEQNKEHHQQIIELASKPHSIINNNTSNNQFNLQFYLNETCKDAMNIVDFVNSLQLTTDDFETTGKLGFIDGISRIFIKELKKLDTEKLPIHCTDFKRETVYIKDNDIWEKENDDKKRVKWAIDTIAQLNLNQLQQWQEKYPECRENNTPANEHFFKLARVALGGFGKEETDKFREKIMRNVLKEVVLDKKAGKPRIPMLPLP